MKGEKSLGEENSVSLEKRRRGKRKKSVLISRGFSLKACRMSPMSGMSCFPDGGHHVPDCCRIMSLKDVFSKKKKELEGKKRISCRPPQLHPEEWMGRQKLGGTGRSWKAEVGKN
jgi:hypothetical protein